MTALTTTCVGCFTPNLEQEFPRRYDRFASQKDNVLQLSVHYMSKHNAVPSSSSSSFVFNSKKLSRKRKDPCRLFNQWNQKRFNGGPTTSTKLYDFINGAKVNDIGPTTTEYGTDYIPLDITCDPSCFHEDYMDNDVPGYTGFDRESLLNFFIPTIAPIIAFFTFDYVAEMYGMVVDILQSSNKFVAVDGGTFQAKILTPAINGLVVPAMALLFATLTSTTISTLRQRQVDVRSHINSEAGELRALECSIESFEAHSLEQDLSRDYLIQYTSRILAECHPKLGSGEDVINPRRGMDSELNGFTALLNKAYGTTVIPAHIADECYASVARLREHRANRISALQSVYPFLHWVSLALLAIGECIAFLMETDQDILVFLNAIQIKILWSMLVGTFTACFTVFIDLLSPFSGSYQISASVGQLHTIKLTLQASKQLSVNRLMREREQMNKQHQETDEEDINRKIRRRRKELDLAQQNEFFNLMNAIENEEDETIMMKRISGNILRASTSKGVNSKGSKAKLITSKKTKYTPETNVTSFKSVTYANDDDQTNGNFS